jgi:hypothetical protein
LFDDLEGLGFAPVTHAPWQKNQDLVYRDREGQKEYQLERIMARRELELGVIEYQVEWEGCLSESDYT